LEKRKWGIPLLLCGFGLFLAAGIWYGIQYGGRLKETAAGQGDMEHVSLADGADREETRIQLLQDGSTVSGEGALVEGNMVRINRGGTYVLSGTLENGQIFVDAESEDTVFLVLSGADIRNTEEAAIYVENAGQTVVVLDEGTENRLQSGEAEELQTAEEESSGGALYARDDLSVTGNGALEVFGYLNNGIHTTNNLTVESGTISVEAVNNGIKGKDSVSITDGCFRIRSGGDGIKSDDVTGEGYGWISIAGGSFVIESEGDGIQAETLLEIDGGDFEMVSGGGGRDVTYSDKNGWGLPDSGWDMSDEEETSTKGLKCGGEIQINGGEFKVDSRDDAVHSNGNVRIHGGSMELLSGDDGIHADCELTVEDGTITVTGSYEGLEGNQIVISGGEISVTASDDGINANGGQSLRGGGPGRPGGRKPNGAGEDETGSPDGEWTGEMAERKPGGPGMEKPDRPEEMETDESGRPGEGSFENESEELPELTVDGGYIYVNAGGDGLDSNGNITINGGTVIVDGPSDSGNGAIDFGKESGGSCVVNGGTMLAVGSSGMGETFDETSKQYSFRHSFDTSFEAGEEITVADSQGNVLFSHMAAKPGNSVVFSHPELTGGSQYVLSAGSQSVEITLDSVSTSSGVSRGKISFH